jgi:hypothetical protein
MRTPTAHLLSIYDEYISGYKDRRAIITAAHATRLRAMGGALTAIVIVNGRVAGTWKRRFERKAVVVSVDLFGPLTRAEQTAVRSAERKFVEFLQG